MQAHTLPTWQVGLLESLANNSQLLCLNQDMQFWDCVARIDVTMWTIPEDTEVQQSNVTTMFMGNSLSCVCGGVNLPLKIKGSSLLTEKQDSTNVICSRPTWGLYSINKFL